MHHYVALEIHSHLVKKENTDLFKLCLPLCEFVCLTISDRGDKAESSDKIQKIFSIFCLKQMTSASSETICEINIRQWKPL